MLEMSDRVIRTSRNFSKGWTMPRARLNTALLIGRAIRAIDAMALIASRWPGWHRITGLQLQVCKHVAGLDDLIDRVAATVTWELATQVGTTTAVAWRERLHCGRWP